MFPFPPSTTKGLLKYEEGTVITDVPWKRRKERVSLVLAPDLRAQLMRPLKRSPLKCLLHQTNKKIVPSC
ncbi:hypothetical protein F2Q70_00036074 [Brassica cretica]|uniref:Uncharacterized protein n=1 Tax=Brassica cretica TaxID=69181 RepID=A0A8S9G5Z2_BRACR|nr:hypothetical protein F2Q68_00031276 [Brassica cretica]KAF2585319.1 hypothetical protein F2Q70_00036074 [Brassica cretica]